MNTQPPLEDINSIVSRFQAWAGVQAPNHARDGVRELTYDEAIRSKRPRPHSEKPLPIAEKSAPGPSASVKRSRTEKLAKPKKKIATPRHVQQSPSRDLQRSPAAVRMVAPEPPAFGQVLAEKVSIQPVTVSQELEVAERRTTALSLRITSTEHAMLKRRAADSNLSVSCYIRNCVLEVESLRAQLTRRLEEQRPAQMQSSVRASAFASCTRFVRRSFFGKTTTLAVRV
jgi:hypothetical protein